jgi:hypothetical protein
MAIKERDILGIAEKALGIERYSAETMSLLVLVRHENLAI